VLVFALFLPYYGIVLNSSTESTSYKMTGCNMLKYMAVVLLLDIELIDQNIFLCIGSSKGSLEFSTNKALLNSRFNIHMLL
jgi:hypothetical protein